MGNMIEYLQTNDKLTIVIPSPVKPIVKYGLAFQGILFLGLSIAFAGVIVYSLNDMGFMAILFASFSVLGVYSGFRYLSRAFHRELIEVTNDKLTVTDKYLFRSYVSVFKISDIQTLNVAGRNNFTSHPLEGKSLDYTGFGVSEKELQYIVEDGVIEIADKNKTKRVGKNLPSWDAEEITKKIKEFTAISMQ